MTLRGQRRCAACPRPHARAVRRPPHHRPGCAESPRVRRWQTDNEQAILGQLGRFGEHLGEAELCLEAACGQVALVVELARVSYPLVDQDKAWPVFIE
jgi:hypothetical protein